MSRPEPPFRRRARAAPGLAVLALAAAGGCASYTPVPIATPPRAQPMYEAAAEFRYSSAGPVTLSAPLDSTRHHDVHALSFESAGDIDATGNRVQARYFRGRLPGARKLVVVLPIWGTSRYPPSRISQGYARRSRGDAHVIWVQGNTMLFPWDALASTESEAEFVELAQLGAKRFRATVVDMRRLVDWAESRAEIDAGRIAFVGFSMSALVTATLLGNDDRVDTGVLMMGAARYADVFASCGDRAAEVREHVMSEYGWTLDEYRGFFEGLFGPADPLRFSGRYDPSKILLFDARFDDCMPVSARDALWRVMGEPRRITLWLRHRSAFYSLTPLGLNFSRRRIYRFLDRVL